MGKGNSYLIVDIDSGLLIDGSSSAIDFFIKKGEEWKNKTVELFFKEREFFRQLLTTMANENCFIETFATIVSFEGNEKVVSLKANKNFNLPKSAAIITIENGLTEKSKENDAQSQKLLKELNDMKYALDKAAVIFITNEKGIVNYVNDKFCELSMYSKEDLIGKTPNLLNSGYHSKDFFKELWNTIKSGNTWRGEVRNRKKNGEFYWVDTVIVPILDNAGKPYRYFSIRYDITSKKNKEFLIEKALKEKDILVNEIHHRVKDNLQIICSLINFKRDSSLDTKQEQMLAEIHGKVISMSLAHDEVYKSDDYTEIDFKNYIMRLEHFLSLNYLPQKIHFDIQGGSVFINLGLAINCGIIISEIISNYIKHALNPEIIPLINISFNKIKSLFLIKIMDNGIGFPDDIIAKKRSGMGLELIEGLATQMKGKMEIYNENGAVYEITINT